MRLNSSDGASVELRIAGYQFPDYGTHAADRGLPRLKGLGNIAVVGDDEWDPNWLQVAGNIALADRRTWAFEDPCLTTWEARELGEWLREVAAAQEQPFRGIHEPRGWLYFTEPNLGLTLEERTVCRVWMRFDFNAEAQPPWTQGGPDGCLVSLDVSVGEVAEAAESWMQNLSEFPARQIKAEDDRNLKTVPAAPRECTRPPGPGRP